MSLRVAAALALHLLRGSFAVDNEIVYCSSLYKRASSFELRTDSIEPRIVDFDPAASDWDVVTLRDVNKLGTALLKHGKLVGRADVPILHEFSARHFSEEMSKGARIMMWDSEFLQSEHGKGLASVPAQLLNEWPVQSADSNTWEAVLSVGAIGSGAPMHVHGPSFFSLLRGTKRWYLYPRGKFLKTKVNASAMHLGIEDWVAEALPTLSGDARPITCVQRSGETLFIPDLWAHATVNIEYSVGVALQIGYELGITNDAWCTKKKPDYFCIHTLLASMVEKRSDFEHFWKLAERSTGGKPWSFMKYLQVYQKFDTRRARDLFFKFATPFHKLLLKTPDDNSKRAGMLAAAAQEFSLASQALGSKACNRKAIEILETAFAKAPGSGIGVALTVLLAGAGRYDRAANISARHLQYFPDAPTATEFLENALKVIEGRPEL